MPPRSQQSFSYPEFSDFASTDASNTDNFLTDNEGMYNDFSVGSTEDNDSIFDLPPAPIDEKENNKSKLNNLFFDLMSKYNCAQPPMYEEEKSVTSVSLASNYEPLKLDVHESNSIDDVRSVSEHSNIDRALSRVRTATFDESVHTEADATDILNSLSYLETNKEQFIPKKSFARQIGIKVDFDKEPVILYRAIDSKQFDLAMNVLVDTPEEATYWVYRTDIRSLSLMWIFLPLHCACFCGAPLRLIEKLVNAYPGSVEAKTLEGKLPLHIACETSCDPEVVNFLLKQYADGLFAKDDYNNTPLQLAMLSDESPGKSKVISALYHSTMDRDDFSHKKMFRFPRQRAMNYRK